MTASNTPPGELPPDTPEEHLLKGSGQPETRFPEDADDLDGGEEWRQRAAQAHERLLRSQAELENFRRRTRREQEEERRYANLDLIRDLLPVLDNLGRAVKSAPASPEGVALMEGVKMVEMHLEQLLARYHCQRIEADAAMFDPNLHQAISVQATDQAPPDTVLHVAQPGYKLHDRVVRPAQVIVAAAPP